MCVLGLLLGLKEKREVIISLLWSNVKVVCRREIKELKQKGSKCHRIKGQIETFSINLQLVLFVIMSTIN